jgi:hypothetical protein
MRFGMLQAQEKKKKSQEKIGSSLMMFWPAFIVNKEETQKQ